MMKARTASGKVIEYSEPTMFDTSEYVEVKLDAPSAMVMEVWEFWLDTLRQKSKVQVVLSDKRRRKIEMALTNYSIQDCKDAILGCAASDFHMGRNGSGRKYDDIELILRDPEHIERFITEYRNLNPDF